MHGAERLAALDAIPQLPVDDDPDRRIDPVLHPRPPGAERDRGEPDRLRVDRRDDPGGGGGDAAAIRDPGRLPRASRTWDVPAGAAGFVTAVDAEAIGLAAVALGAGRTRVEDVVDHAVGLVLHRKVGDRVEPGEPLCTLHHGTAGAEPPDAVARRVLDAYRLGEQPPPAAPLVLARIA